MKKIVMLFMVLFAYSLYCQFGIVSASSSEVLFGGGCKSTENCWQNGAEQCNRLLESCEGAASGTECLKPGDTNCKTNTRQCSTQGCGLSCTCWEACGGTCTAGGDQDCSWGGVTQKGTCNAQGDCVGTYTNHGCGKFKNKTGEQCG